MDVLLEEQVTPAPPLDRTGFWSAIRSTLFAVNTAATILLAIHLPRGGATA